MRGSQLSIARDAFASQGEPSTACNQVVLESEVVGGILARERLDNAHRRGDPYE